MDGLDLVQWARETARQQMPTQELVERSALWMMADEIERFRALLARYRNETPLDHQPYMIAHEVDQTLGRGS